MPAPDIILNKGDILLTQSASGIGIELDNSALLNGLVELTNQLTDRYVNGDLVLFNPEGATILNYSSVDYFLTKESNIYYKEVPV